ncbi:MAG: hypothetical protein ACOVRN_16955 [Flavobacterium sp.]
MVKNAGGGNKSKGFARKNFVKREAALRVAQEDGEMYAQAVKVLGGSIASALDLNGNPLRVHIRGKFRGRNKRDNFISGGTWLLVEVPEWQSKSSEVRDCNILEVYSDTDKHRLKNTVTNVDWSRFLANDTKTLGADEDKNDGDAGFDFADEATQEYEELIREQASKATIFTMENGEEIDVDDI